MGRRPKGGSDLLTGQLDRKRYWTLSAALFVAYVIAARIGIELEVAEGLITPVWAPTGIALAALVLYGRRLWPAVALAAFVANATSGASIPEAAFISVGNTLEAVVGATLLLRIDFRPALDRVRDVFALIGLAAIASTTIAATNGATTLLISGDVDSSDYGSAWLLWWLGDAMGNLVVAPLLLVLAQRPWRELDQKRLVEAGLLLALLVAVTSVVFLGGLWRYPHLVFPAPRLGGPPLSSTRRGRQQLRRHRPRRRGRGPWHHTDRRGKRDGSRTDRRGAHRRVRDQPAHPRCDPRRTQHGRERARPHPRRPRRGATARPYRQLGMGRSREQGDLVRGALPPLGTRARRTDHVRVVSRISSSGGPRARQEHGRTRFLRGDAVFVRASCFPARWAPALDPRPRTSHQGRLGDPAAHARDGAGHHRSQAHRRAPRFDPLHGVARAANAAHGNPRVLRHARGEGRPTRRGDYGRRW